MLTFFKKKWYLVSFALILVVAFCFRFYKLGQVPHGMTWDEAAIGYNGYAIFKTRRDEWLNRLPISFQSFGDYKAPLAIYINGLFTLIFGLNLWAVRLPFALFSITAIAGMMLLARQLFKNDKLSLISGVLITLSPWHIHYSRVGFEAGIALALIIWGIFFLIKTFEKKQYFFLNSFLACSLLTASLYTYHSAKLTAPLLVLIILLLNIKFIKNNFKKLFLPGLLTIILLLPLAKDSFFGLGMTRSNTLIFSQNLTPVQMMATIAENFTKHLSLNFLIFGETNNTLRHGDGRFGVLFPITLLFALIGLFTLVINYKKKKNKYFWLLLLWPLVGILPASLGTALEIPHSNRALSALPGFLLLATYGIAVFYQKIQRKFLLYLIAVFYLINFLFYLKHYYLVFSKESTDSFKEGYLETFEFVQNLEEQTDRIIFTNDYGQAYIYALFFRKTNPFWYHGGSLIKYEFTEDVKTSDLDRNNAVVVASQYDDLPEKLADKIVYGSDGSIRFKIYITKRNF